jgi:hypothetical protein
VDLLLSLGLIDRVCVAMAQQYCNSYVVFLLCLLRVCARERKLGFPLVSKGAYCRERGLSSSAGTRGALLLAGGHEHE